MSELSNKTKNLISKYQISQKLSQEKDGIATIHVDEVASKVAAFYEKIRGIIDWKEDHLLKRSAIERSLRRRIFPQINIANGKMINNRIAADNLVLELIRSGHFPNDKIEEYKIPEVQKVIDKYVYIINESPKDREDSRIQLVQWISSIAACEIEETLSPALKERALIDFMYSEIKEFAVLSKELAEKEGVTEEEKNIQIFINVQKSLFDLDSSVLSYHLIKYKYSSWTDLSDSDERINDVVENIYEIKKEIEDHLDHPMGGKVSQLCQKYNTPYLILGDIISEDPNAAEKKIENPVVFESAIRDKYGKRLKGLNSRLKRAAVYSTISIFLTNIVALLAVEIPISKYLIGNFSTTAYLVDILFPTILMAFLVITIQPPPKGNLEKVIMETIKIAYGKRQKEIYEIKKFRKKGPIFSFMISLIYLISFAASIGLMVWALNKIDFPPFSYLVFVIFLSLIAFAGTKIREKGKELHMVDLKEGFFATIIDLFALPIILLGKWLTLRWKKYNVISIFFNALIDMPLSVFVEFLEQWRYFLKEKKERL